VVHSIVGITKGVGMAHKISIFPDSIGGVKQALRLIMDFLLSFFVTFADNEVLI